MSNLEDRVITKVKFDKGQTIVTLEESYEGWGKDITVKAYDDRHPDFTNAMQELVPHVVSLLKLPQEYAQDMAVSGVSFSENDHQGFGAVITCQKSLDGINSPLVINTPHTHEDACEQGLSVMPTAMRNQLRTVYKQAEEFANGKRAQGDLLQEAA